MKKLTAFVLSAMMVLSLAACGSSKTETPAEDTSTPAEDTAPAEDAKLTYAVEAGSPVRKWHWPTATTLYPWTLRPRR